MRVYNNATKLVDSPCHRILDSAWLGLRLLTLPSNPLAYVPASYHAVSLCQTPLSAETCLRGDFLPEQLRHLALVVAIANEI